MREWDARTYDRVADPMTRWGARVLERLALSGMERVLDAGCGSGRVTEHLLERLPNGHVVALDASEEMLDEARRRLARFGARVSFVQADLALPLPLREPVDAILSTAAFHWILDHDALFRNLAAVLRPGGQLVAQCGGAGNIRSVVEALRAAGVTEELDFRFETPTATARRLQETGFVDVETWLTNEPTRVAPGATLDAYLEAVCLRTYLARRPSRDRRAIVRRVAARLPDGTIDYVRLNITAWRAGGRATGSDGKD